MAVQVLVILLDYGLPIRKRGEEGAPLPCVSADDIEAKGFNIFRKVLSKIDSPDHLTFMYKGFVRLLNNVHQAENSYLPYSVTRVSIEQELLILLWKCLEEIPRFMTYILKHCDINEIVVPICYFMLEGRKDPAKVGLMYLCTFTLLKLSGERNFGVALNKPYAVSLPVDVPLFTGNHADLLVIVLHKLIVSGLDRLSALYNCFLTIICNVSPYCKSLCNVSAVKLVNLFQLFVSPRFLYASESNHTYVVLLLETFNNIVQYQYEGNSDVVYAIIRRKEAFETLANLNLPVAIKIAKDIAEKKDSKSISVADNNGTTAKSNTKSNSNSSTLSKKYSGSREEDVIDNVTAEGAPTDLISTQSVERRVNTAGEISDVRTNSAAGEGDNRLSARNADGTMKFVPTAAWLQAVKAELPLHTIMRLLKHLVPQLEELASVGADGIATADEAQLVSYISKTTMVGLLPVPHPIVIRKYQPNKYTSLWFTAFQWGVIFMHNQTVPLFDGKKVKLFMVQTVQ